MNSTRHQPFTYDQFKTIYSQVPRLTVEVIIQVKQGIVLTKRQETSWQGQWHIPGGTVLYKEPIKDAVQRIAQEELGVSVHTEQLIGYIEYPSEEKERGFGWSVGLAFVCQPVGEAPLEQWQKNNIEVFSELPKNVIAEQRDLLYRVLQIPKQSNIPPNAFNGDQI